MNKRIQYLPWERGETTTDPETVQYLTEQCNATLADDSYIAPDARIYPHAFSLGSRSFIAADAQIRGQINIGEDCTVNAYAFIAGDVNIGNAVRIGSLASILGFNHNFENPDEIIYKQGVSAEGITVEDDVWIGTGSIILDGVTIGAHSIVAAGAVVTKSTPPYSIIAGNPAKVIRDRRSPRKPQLDATGKALSDYSDIIAKDWPNILEYSTSEVDGQTAYFDHRHNTPTVRAWCDAIEIAAAFGGLPSMLTREQYIEKLQGFQDPESGLIPDPWNPPADDYNPTILNNGHARYHLLAVGYALECLDSHIKHPAHAVENLNGQKLLDHLDSLNWKTNAWGGGDWIDCFGTGMYHNLKYFDCRHQPETLIGWMQTHANPNTGLWGDPTPDAGLLQPVNGFYRASRGTYAQFGIPLPYPEATIDSVLRHTRDYGNFESKGITACNLLDITHPLWLCCKQTDYRRDEINQLMTKLIPQTTARYVKGKGFAWNPDTDVESLQGTEMWMSIIYLMADLLGLTKYLAYSPKGVHRLQPALQLTPA